MSQHSRVGSKVGDSEEEEAEVEAGDTEDIKLRLRTPTLSHFSPDMTAKTIKLWVNNISLVIPDDEKRKRTIKFVPKLMFRKGGKNKTVGQKRSSPVRLINT